ncbi:trigger factor [Ignavibacterium sp.]|uniref:trigger factor n=1 Tax=Ignavibacterium sp. TaxID=2651167 RepID=UPI0021FF4CD9|nr:trigger factor [Ignavibacterium sp.]BDQ02059.1 MAG: trigger factor [Ignavibacterium sp.]
MEYNVNVLNASVKEVEIKLSYDEIKESIENEVKKQTKNLQVPGFRKGKVPRNILKKMFGDALEYEAADKVATEFFWKVADEKDLRPIGKPAMTSLDFEPEKHLTFKVKYETLPEIIVQNYKDIEIEVPDFVVTDEEVQKEIEFILKANQTLIDADEVGDDRNYHIEVEINRTDEQGNILPDTKPEKLTIDLTNEQIHPQIIENSRGKKVGESFTFQFADQRKQTNSEGVEEDVTDNYYYTAKILSIKKVQLPELNEELVKKVTKDRLSDVEAFKDEIKKDIQKYYDQRVEEITRTKLLSEIIKNNDFTPPQTLVNNVLEEYLKSEENYAKQNKISFNKEEARNRLRKSAENEVKWYLIKEQIQKVENISVTEDELKEFAQKEAEQTGLSVDKLMNYYKASNQVERIIDEKLFDFLKSNNKIKRVDPKTLYPQKEEINEQ